MNPLIFFAVVIVIDLILKSAKDKKKIEESRQKKIQELRNQQNNQEVKPVKPTETRVKREVQKNPSLSKKNRKDSFLGEGKSYRDEHEGYRERYEERYENINASYKSDDITLHKSSTSLYDENAIQRSKKKDYDVEDVRNYGREKEKIEIPVPTASTFKNDVLNGIIFSEILGKPKSMQKRNM